MTKGLLTTTFPSPFGVEGDKITAFAVIHKINGNGFVGSRKIIVTFDIFASEAAFDAGKIRVCPHEYTITEIDEGTVIDSMDDLFDTIYQVILTNDPAFVDAVIIGE